MVRAVPVPEAQVEESEHGLVCKSDGWFVVNARDVRWYRTGDARISNLAGDTRFEQLGVGIAEAFVRLRAYAYAHDRRLSDLASDIVARRLRNPPTATTTIGPPTMTWATPGGQWK